MTNEIIPIMKLSVKLLKIISDAELISDYMITLKKSEVNTDNKKLVKMVTDYSNLSLSILHDAVDRKIEKRKEADKK